MNETFTLSSVNPKDLFIIFFLMNSCELFLMILHGVFKYSAPPRVLEQLHTDRGHVSPRLSVRLSG